METPDVKVVVDRGRCMEDKYRRMERLKTRSAPPVEVNTSSEISPSTPKVDQTTHLANETEDDEGRNLMDLKLYRAAMQGHINIFQNALGKVDEDKKLTHSAIFDQVSPIGNTYLHIAAKFDRKDIVNLIARNSPTLITKKNFKGETALHLAARAGNLNTMKTLLTLWKDNADLPSIEGTDKRQIHHKDFLLRIKNDEGNTALHEAVVNSTDEIACQVIKEDPEGAFYLNDELESPLSLSAKAGYEKCISAILSFREELEKMIDQVKSGKSPVHEAISSRKQGVLELILLKEPRFLRFTDKEGRFPLHYAASVGYHKEVSYLLKFSINATEKDKNDLLPVHWASAIGNVPLIQELLLHCPDPEELLDQNGRSMLHFMAERGKYAAIGYFLKDPTFKNLINMKDNHGNTPLHVATMHSWDNTVFTLTFSSKVNQNLLNNKGMTALDVAEEMFGDGSTTRQRYTLAILRSAKVPRGLPGKTLNILNQTTAPVEKTTVPVEKTQMASLKKYKDRVNTLLLVSTLATTVTFAAGFTMPGGYNNSDPDQGMATLLDQRVFQVYILCDTIAMYSSMIAAIALIWAQLGEIKIMRGALIIAIPFLTISLGMMSVAFMTGVSLVVCTLKWLYITILSIAVTCFIIGSVIFFPLWFPSTSSRRFGFVNYNPLLFL